MYLVFVRRMIESLKRQGWGFGQREFNYWTAVIYPFRFQAAAMTLVSTFLPPSYLLLPLLATFGSIMKTANFAIASAAAAAPSDIVYDLPSAAASALAADPSLQPLIDWYHSNLPHHRDKETG